MIDYAPDNRLFVLADDHDLLADDGRSLVASPGWLTELDAGGRPLAQSQSPPLSAACWHPPTGGWFAAGPAGIWRFQFGRLTPFAETPPDRPVTHLAAGPVGLGV